MFFLCVFQAIRVFFRTNQTTCQEWVNRMGCAALTASVRVGRHASAARFGLNLLAHWTNTRRAAGKFCFVVRKKKMKYFYSHCFCRSG